ncbi:MAG: DUF1292 domain-containing protein [Bacilli bacterium]|jgi:uncharacterized protein YrzB (UPF0473 family)
MGNEESKKMIDKIVVIDKDGQEREAEVLSVFKIEEYKNNYILYTFNEIDSDNMIKIYASTLIIKEDMYSFESIETEQEWNAIKDIMRDLSQEA